MVIRSIFLFCALSLCLSAQVTQQDIEKGPNENWLTYAGDYASQRHSSLDQIHRGNVNRLVAKWVRNIPGARKLETVPLVYQGVMYATNSDEVYALDARNGKVIWHYEVETVGRKGLTRGVALVGDRVFYITSDCRLIALNRKTGAFLWENEFASAAEGYWSSLAPLAVKDQIIVGVGGGGTGQRGFIAAISGDHRRRALALLDRAGRG